MTLVSSTKDVNALTMTMVAEFDAVPQRVWQIWEDPRQLERWWGPPTWPATFERHELTVGGQSAYYMTGPEGEKSRGWWETTAIDPPNSLEFDDGFAEDDGSRNLAMGTTHTTVILEALGGRTQMTLLSAFASVEQMEQMLEMGMQEGMQLALGQIDALLAEDQ
jgi:uncharacterized protein YndB with AHSA1/START domain